MTTHNNTPTGGDDRSRRQRRTRGQRDRQIAVRAVRRDPPDLRKLSRAIAAIAIAQAEAEAQAQVDAAVAAPKLPKAVPDEVSNE